MAEDRAELVPISRPRLTAALLSLEFLLDTIRLSRSGADLLEPLLFAAIVQANLAALRHDRELQQRYGDTGETLPDAYRRPISNAALANSLALPVETVRRRVNAMAARGLCVITPVGVCVPQAAVASERHAAIQQARLIRLQRFHDELQEAGFFAAGGSLTEPIPRDLRRAVNTALSQYMLRSCDRLISLGGAVTDGFVLLGLAAANCRDLRPDLETAEVTAALAPCRAAHLAQRLDLADETVRRRLSALGERDRARRVGKAWLVVAPRSETLARIIAENEADLLRLFERLREIERLRPR
ncbi:MAG: hypothetical protein ACXWKN_18265 [Phenylobacterium sp.]